MMQQQMPAQLPEGLAALLSLTSAMQQGRVAPTTPDGQPTVAAQAAQAAQQQMGMQPQGGPPQGMPPGPQMQAVAQGAGMAAQKQMQDQQEMMQKLPQMIAAMQQRQQAMDQGIASAPGAQSVNMAEGGIVGYSGRDGSEVNLDKQAEEDRLAFFKRVLMPLGLSLADLKQMPASVINNTVLRAARAAGIPIPNIPGGGFGSNLENYGRYVQGEVGVPDYSQDLYPPPTPPAQATPTPVAEQPKPQEQQPSTQQRAKVGLGLGAGFGNIPTTGIFAMPAEPLPADYSEAQNEYQKIFGNIKQMRTEPATPEEGVVGAKARAQALRDLYVSQGLDPDYLANAIKQTKEFGDKRQATLENRRAGIQERAPMQEMISFLTSGARGGRGLGAIMGAGAVGAEATSQANRAALDKIEDLQLQYKAEDIKEVRALQNMQIQIANGQFDAAMKSKDDAIAAQNKKRELESNAQLGYARMLEGQVGKEAERRKDIYSGQIQARGQNVQAAIAQMNDRVRLQIEAMKEEGGKKDADLSRMLRVIQEDPIIKGLLKENEKLAEIPNDASASRALSNIARIEQRLNQLRKEHGFNEIPVEPVIRGTPGGQRAPAR